MRPTFGLSTTETGIDSMSGLMRPLLRNASRNVPSWRSGRILGATPPATKETSLAEEFQSDVARLGAIGAYKHAHGLPAERVAAAQGRFGDSSRQVDRAILSIGLAQHLFSGLGDRGRLLFGVLFAEELVDQGDAGPGHNPFHGDLRHPEVLAQVVQQLSFEEVLN